MALGTGTSDWPSSLIPTGPVAALTENGYVESFNARLRDELLDGEAFHTVAEARVLIERWRQHYNTARPHSALGYRPPAPGVVRSKQRLPAAIINRHDVPRPH